MKLLVVEDDELLQQGLALALTGEGYVCDCAATAAEANSLLITSQYSMVIPDLGLPDMDGAALLRQWRRQQIDLPVLILTARDAPEDRVDGLDAGADDYGQTLRAGRAAGTRARPLRRYRATATI